MGVVVRRYNIDFLILLIPTPVVSALFCSSIPTFCSLKKFFFVLVPVHFCNLCNIIIMPGLKELGLQSKLLITPLSE